MDLNKMEILEIYNVKLPSKDKITAVQKFHKTEENPNIICA